MKKVLAYLICILSFCFTVQVFGAVVPFESGNTIKGSCELDRLVLKSLKAHNLKPANLCSDQVFIRRVYLDLTGTLPEANTVRNFITDKSHDKREKLVEALFSNEHFADYWAMKWCDTLRVKAEFPINLWPNAVQAYYQWIHQSIKENKPYNQFAREMITSSGSNFRVPAVNFYRAIQGHSPESIASAVALTFMGSRMDSWSDVEQEHFKSLFSHVAYKKTAEWKEEIVYHDPARTEALETILPDGKKVRIEPTVDPRFVFADWLISRKNPYFAKNCVNRLWAAFFGRGIIHEVDNISDDNPPVNPELLAYLEKELVMSGYDTQHVMRLIVNSQTYQQSSIPVGDPGESERYFACYPVRQLEAEVLVDLLNWISGSRESYSSPIPEPFTFIPEEHRTIELADGSITSQFLEMFGRPSRDTGLVSERNLTPSNAQRLHMINSSHVQNKIERSNRIKRVINSNKKKPVFLIQAMYLTILSRHATELELRTVNQYFKKTKNMNQAGNDLAWALINSKEFMFKH